MTHAPRQPASRALLTMLNDPEWSAWSDREIARRCAVDNSFVSKLRPTVTVDNPQLDRTYIDKHGNTSTMNTAGIEKGPTMATTAHD